MTIAFLISGVLDMTSVVTPLGYVNMIVDITEIFTQDVVSIFYILIHNSKNINYVHIRIYM